MSRDAIGMVGLGSLGMAVARRLLAAGHALFGYRRREGDTFRAAGGVLLSSPAEVFARTEILFTCLPDVAALNEVAEAFLSSKATGRIVIDLSTTALAERFDIRRRLQDAGSTLIDCPISGLASALEQGTATLFAACEPGEYTAVQALLRAISHRTYHVGPFGTGTKLKYMANFLMAVHAGVAAELIGVAQAAGIQADLAIRVLSESAGGSLQLATRGPGMARRDYANACATLDGLSEDLAEIEDFVQKLGLHSPFLGGTIRLVDQARALGFGRSDPTALIEPVLANMASTKQDGAADRWSHRAQL